MPFDPQKLYTNREMYGPALEITDQQEAEEYFAEVVEYQRHFSERPVREVRIMVLNNLDFFAGHYGRETAERFHKVFHPIFEREGRRQWSKSNLE